MEFYIYLLDRKGMSKWVDTAIKPVPERSHMLKTWPTKAGPPPCPVEIRTVEGNLETGSEEGKLLMADDDDGEDGEFLDGVEEIVSGWADSEGEASERTESASVKGRWIFEECVAGGGVLRARKDERLVEAVDRKRERWAAGCCRRWRLSAAEAIR